jgi:hypothetical protein
MADSNSEFWRKLAGRFRAINCSEISLTWTSFPDTGQLELGLHSEHSTLGRSAKVQLEALCTDAGLKLKADSENPIFFWFNILIHESPNDLPGEGEAPLYGTVRKYATGHINNPCLASANLCSAPQMRAKKVEQDAAKAERGRLQELLNNNLAEESEPLSNLRAIGLDIDISEESASTIWAELLIIDGRAGQGFYPPDGASGLILQHLYDAYHAIAGSTVGPNTSNEFLDTKIPAMVYAFKVWRQWNPNADEVMYRRFLRGPATEWKGKRIRMKSTQKQTGPLQDIHSPKRRSRGEGQFPRRAAWLRERLKERGWDHNHIYPHGGPDRKTVLQILAGENVRATTLEKLIAALNNKRIGPAINLTDIPSD